MSVDIYSFYDTKDLPVPPSKRYGEVTLLLKRGENHAKYTKQSPLFVLIMQSRETVIMQSSLRIHEAHSMLDREQNSGISWNPRVQLAAPAQL